MRWLDGITDSMDMKPHGGSVSAVARRFDHRYTVSPGAGEAKAWALPGVSHHPFVDDGWEGSG